jgi:hypothetical protein
MIPMIKSSAPNPEMQPIRKAILLLGRNVKKKTINPTRRFKVKNDKNSCDVPRGFGTPSIFIISFSYDFITY